MTTTGILAFGAYVPRLRLQRSAIAAANNWFAPNLKGLAKGEKAIANWDEDAITMAVEAARDCLGDSDRAAVANISLASTTLPYADRLNSGIIKEALLLSDHVAASDQGGSMRAATSALVQILQSRATHLLLASDLRKARPASEGEMLQGDGAAALLLGAGAHVIARHLGSHSLTIDFIDHYRANGEDFDYGWEARWIRDEGYSKIIGQGLREALQKMGVTGADIAHAIIPIAVRGVAGSLAKKAGIADSAVADVLQATIGDTGVAHPLLMLAATLEKAKPGEKILLTGFGQGVDVLLFEVTEAITRLPARQAVAGWLARGKADSNYMRYLFHRGLVDLERGMRAEFDQKQPGTTLYRQRKAVLGLVGGRCTKTGTVQFPKTQISVNPNDHAVGTQEDYPLAERRARVFTYTADSLTYCPSPPQFYGAVDFEGGGRLTTEFTDCDAQDIEVGREMRMMFRIKGVDDMRHFTKYFWKAVPVA